MTEIEFLDPGPLDDAPPLAAGPGVRGVVGSWLAPALWLAAAGLALGAALVRVYSIDIRQGGARYVQAMDAWGRYRRLGDITPNGHGPRFAILLLVCAVLLLGVAVAAAATRLGAAEGAATVRPAPVVTGLGVAGLAGAATAAGALYLEVAALRDTLDAQTRAQDTPGNLVSNIINYDVRVGLAVWLAAGAAACGLLALAAPVLARRRAPGVRLADSTGGDGVPGPGA